MGAWTLALLQQLAQCLAPLLVTSLHVSFALAVTLLTYIFNHDVAGCAFFEALVRAQARGVQVRELVDAVGARYSYTSMVKQLQQAGVPVAVFLPARLTRLLAQTNLRNPRKIMVVDGALGFTGGMNISAPLPLTGPLPLARPCGECGNSPTRWAARSGYEIT